MSLPFFPLRLATAAALLGCSAAFAASGDTLRGFELERLETNIGRGTLLVGNGELLVPQGLNVSLLGHYQSAPLVLDTGDDKGLRIVEQRATAVLSASYGLLPWLEVGGQLPVVLYQQGENPDKVGLSELTAQGLGTPILQARLGVLSRRRRQAVDLALDVGAGLPFGTPSALAGDNGFRFHARMTAGTQLGWLQTSLEAGILFRPLIPLLSSDTQASREGADREVRIGAAVATTGKGMKGELGLRATFANPKPSVELLGGVRFPLVYGLEVFALGGPGFGKAVGTPLFRVVTGLSLRMEPPPRIAFLDESADRELQLVLATPASESTGTSVRPVAAWELNALSRGDSPVNENGSLRVPSRPYQPSAQEKVLLRGELHFARGSAELPGVVPLLDQAVLRMSEQSQLGQVLIEGHSDKDSADSFMAVRRAQAVRRYLIDQGVPATQVRIQGFGSDWPVSAQPATDQERQLNRRAEVFVLVGSSLSATAQPTPP